MRFWSLINVIFLLLTSLVQANNTKFFHLNFEQGLSQSTVNCIIKDSRGYFWFGTNSGLNKWNGYSITVYSHDESDKNSIGQGRINAIYEDTDSSLWIATSQGGLCKYIPESDLFLNIPIVQKDIGKTNKNNIVSIVPFYDQFLLATITGELFLFNPITFEYSRVLLFDENNDPVTNIIINKLYVDKDEVVWIASSKGAIQTRNHSKQGNRTFIDGVIMFPAEDVYDIFFDTRGNIWFGTYNSGAYKYNISRKHTTQYKAGIKDGTNLSHPNVRTFCQDREGNLWLGTGGGGINLFDYESQQFSYFDIELANHYSLSSNIIYTIYPDEENNLWIGTYNGGVCYTNYHRQRFNHIRSYGKPDELTHNSVLSFCKTNDGKIWLGTDGGGINIYDKSTGKFTYFKLNDRFEVITKLVSDGNNKIYIGTYREGLYVYNRLSGSLKNYRTGSHNKSLPNNDIWDIALGHNGEVWIGTLGSGLSLFNEKSGEFTNYSLDEEGENTLKDGFISSLLVDSKNRLWIGTYLSGLYYLSDKESGSFKQINGKEKLKSSEVRAIFEDSKKRLWVGTLDGGLNLLLDEEKGFISLTVKDGLPSNAIQAILEDKDNNLWLSTNMGLSKVMEKDGEYIFRNYTAADGLQSNEYNLHSSLIDESGQLYFGGINGFNSFYPDDISDSKSVGPVIINSLEIIDDVAASGSLQAVVDKNVEYTDKVEIDFNQSTITFKYAMLDYILPKKNTYKYRLLPFDKEWIDAGNRRSTTYTNLDPGDYVFQVKGINSQHIENERIAKLEVKVLPPLWKTTWFRVLIIGSLLLLLLLLYRIRVSGLRRQGLRLKKLVDERTGELVSLNKVLEERNVEIFQQSEELKIGQEKLIAVNKNLEESNKKIEKQKSELQQSRNNLEKTVRERTFELETAKKRAEESEQLKMAFLSNMSHEIRTPMNAIVGFASLLADLELSREEKEEYVRQINVNSESLLLLIDDILDLSKIEANQLRISPEKFEVYQFVNQVYVNWKQIQKSKNSKIEFKFISKLPKGSIYVFSDEQRIRQVVNNLLDNAFKFTSHGEIKLMCELKNSNVVLSVSDTGIGVSEEDKNYIFDRFRKAESSGNKLYRGAGLGLTISHKITKMLKGEIWIESIKGQGSVFHLSLPVFELGSNTLSKKHSKTIPALDIDLSGVNILIAEDEEANFFYLSGVLSKKGAIVDHAGNGEEAIKMSTIKDYKIILMDIKMPQLNGIEATQRIKMMFPNQMVVAQTAYARPEEEAEFRKIGFDGYLTKPIKIDALYHVIKSLL